MKASDHIFFVCVDAEAPRIISVVCVDTKRPRIASLKGDWGVVHGGCWRDAIEEVVIFHPVVLQIERTTSRSKRWINSVFE